MNEGGGNQFGNYQLQPKYGDVAKQTQLTKAAPMSGAPYAAQALNTPRRSQRGAVRGSSQNQAGPAGALPAPADSPSLPPERIYQDIASLPGASPTVQRIFGG